MSEIETKKKLLGSRKDLLDIGLRNSMISFRAGAKSLMVVDEVSEEVLKVLFRQGKSMSFAPMPEKRLRQLAKSHTTADPTDEDQDQSTLELLHELEGVNWGASSPSVDELDTVRRHTDTKLQTALTDRKR